MNQLEDILIQLRLPAFISVLREQRESPRYADLSFEERLLFLAQEESARRHTEALHRRLAAASIPKQATIDNFTFLPTRGVQKSKLAELATGEWIKQHMNLIITGPTGSGKSFLAGCYADRACRLGLSVRTFKTHDLARELLRARVEATHKRLFLQLKKVDVMVLDEWLRDPLPNPETREILDLLDARYGAKSHILATQLPVETWHQRFEDPTLADALLDRLVHSAHRIALAGDSMRKRSTPS